RSPTGADAQRSPPRAAPLQWPRPGPGRGRLCGGLAPRPAGHAAPGVPRGRGGVPARARRVLSGRGRRLHRPEVLQLLGRGRRGGVVLAGRLHPRRVLRVPLRAPGRRLAGAHPVRHVPCRNESGTEFRDCTFNLGTFRPTVRQGLLQSGSQDFLVWAPGFLLAKLLAAGWLPAAAGRPL
ncbi:unnamed protein product, partial [Prorocentrum cordatum]